MAGTCPSCGLTGDVTYGWTQIVNIARDPFEISALEDTKTMLGMGGALAAPSTAYLYDWNILPIGQLLWMKELETYQAFPPMQDPASYNLDQVLAQIKNARTAGRSD
jgi:arylsulfatase